MSRATAISVPELPATDPLVVVASSAKTDGKDVEVVDAVNSANGGSHLETPLREEPIVTRRVSDTNVVCYAL